MQWVDDDFVTQNDMLSLDSEVVDIAEAESIIISGNSGIIRRAKEDCASILTKFMSFSNLSQNDLTVRNVNMPVFGPDLRFNYAGFAQITITGEANDSWSVIKRWAVACALRKFYRAAANKNSDRYSDKFEEINSAIQGDYWRSFKQRGIPLCFNPLEAPGAIMLRSGRFIASNVALVAGAGSVADSYDFAITWVGVNYVSPTAKHNNESYRSNRITQVMDGAGVARVSIAGLTPPNGNQPDFTLSSCRYSPGVAKGWNVWACKTPTQESSVAGADFDYPVMYRQNPALLALTQTSYTLTGDPVLSGETLDNGQYDDSVLSLEMELVRA